MSEPLAGVEDWWARHQESRKRFHKSAPLTLAMAQECDCVAWAFASGYQAAGEALFGETDQPRALCATEDEGNHPRAIRTTFRDGRITGTKRFVTLGTFAERLLVVVTTGEAAGRPVLKLVEVDARAPGVTVTGLPPLPMVPELPHASVVFDSVEALRVLPGDGYADYLKPFRTVEDTHVHLALVGYLLSVALRWNWRRDVVTALHAQSAALQHIAQLDPQAVTTHLALAGALDASRRLMVDAESEWAQTDDEVAACWRRDRTLLKVAGAARKARLDRAWSAIRDRR